MSLDDELRRRLKDAADQAGAGVNPAALAQAAATTVPAAALPMKLLAGLGAVGLVVGGALGFTALKPADDDTAGFGATVEVQQYSLYDCPGGAPSGVAYPGDRVYITGRDESGGWLEVRDPRNQGSTLWVPSSAVDPDTVIDVPIRSCDEPIELIAVEATTTTTTLVRDTTTTSATPTTTPATTPVTAPPTTQAPDTQKPVVSQGTRNPSEIYDVSYSANCAVQSAITVQVTDNVGVTQVRGTYGAGLPGSPLVFTHGAGNTWTATFGPFSLDGSYFQDVVISMVARDAAGNSSNATTVTVRVWGTCLI